MPHSNPNIPHTRGGIWVPDTTTHPDAELVGTLGLAVSRKLRSLTPLRQVYAVARTWKHIVAEHAGQFDHAYARELLPAILRSPWYVYAGRKTNTIVIAGQYDATHFLVVPLKVVRMPQHELWLQSLYIRNDTMVWAELRKGEVYYVGKEEGTPGRSG